MCEVGAWLNFAELEDSLTLEELSELYMATMKRQNRMLKMVAASMGADIDLDEDEDETSEKRSDFSLPNPHSDSTILDQYDIEQLPFGLGYDTMV